MAWVRTVAVADGTRPLPAYDLSFMIYVTLCKYTYICPETTVFQRSDSFRDLPIKPTRCGGAIARHAVLPGEIMVSALDEKGAVCVDGDLLAPLGELVLRSEDWILRRVHHYSVLQGYAPYSSTLAAAWRTAVKGMSETVCSALDIYKLPPNLPAGMDYESDPIARYGIDKAISHRARGVPMAMYIGGLKCYRRAYMDLVEESGLPQSIVPVCRQFVLGVFDRIELGLCSEWSGQDESGKLQELQAGNAAIIREKLKYLTIFESLRDPVILLDSEGRIENMNNSACVVFGGGVFPGAVYYGGGDVGSLADTLGDHLDDLMKGVDVERTLDTLQGPRRFAVKSRPMLDLSQTLLGAAVILTDVTDYREALENVRQASEAKSAFLATMSHEIRTPLNGILGMTQLLRESNPSAGQSKQIDAISASGETLLAILNDVLDLSKIEAGRLELEKIDFSLDRVLGGMRALTQYQAEKKGLAFSIEKDADVPARLRGDPAKLGQVLLNLLGNAIKFTERGGVTLRVSMDAAAGTEQPPIRFAIEDTGIGIEENALARLFQTFSQGDTSIARRYGGTGLGLVICKRIVEACGGEIGVESSPGVGSTFWFAIPLCSGRTPVEDAEIRAVTALPPLSVLVVEDNEINAMVLSGFLELDGHRITWVRDGEEAVGRAAAEDFDVVLMDLRMPGVDGMEATRRIRLLENAARAGVPIIATTANIERGKMATGFEAGVDGFLGKPFQRHELTAALRRVLDRSAAARAERDGREPDIDPVVLAEHVALLGRDRVEAIVKAVGASTQKLLGEMQCALKTGNAILLADKAHALKGAAQNVGLAALAAEAKAIEAAATRGDLAYDAEATERLWADAIAALEANRKRLCEAG